MASRAPPLNQPPIQHSSIRRNLFPQGTSSNTTLTSTAQPYTRPTSQSSASSHAPSRTASASYTGIPTSRRPAAQGAYPNSAQLQGQPGVTRAGTATDGSGVHSRPATKHSASSSGDTVPLAEAGNSVSVNETRGRQSSEDVDDDIIERDQDGGFKVEPLAGVKMEHLEGESDGDDESAKVNARLIELYRSHSRQHIDPMELKAAVQASLREKVASLDDDKWMYEPDLEPDSQT